MEDFMYNPKPIDTRDIVLSDDLLELKEKIAESCFYVISISI